MVGGSHTGLNLAAAFIESLISFGLIKKVHCVVIDNTGNMNTFILSVEKMTVEKVYD